MNSSPRNNNLDDNIDIPGFKRSKADDASARNRAAQQTRNRKPGYDYDDNAIAVKRITPKAQQIKSPSKRKAQMHDETADKPQTVAEKRVTPSRNDISVRKSNTASASRDDLKRAVESAPRNSSAVSTLSARSTRKIQNPESDNASNGATARKLTAGTVVRRVLLCLLTAIVLTVGSLYALLMTIAVGPSVTIRDKLVLSALQASATKWVPRLFLDQKTIDAIWDASQEVTIDIIPAGNYGNNSDSPNNPTEDEWAAAQDGMIYETINGATYKAYVLLIKDPSRIYVATSCDFSQENRYGLRIFDIADREGAVAVINAGEYVDNGFSLGDTPIGLTYSKGDMVWNDNIPRTFIGFNSENRLIVKNSITYSEAEALGIRDAVSFQWGNLLIEQDGDNIKLHYADGNTGAAQRTAIGQRADGTVIMVVTDGRTASSIGATRNDIIDIMVSYGAVSAGMLDGGSSAMMYYRDWYTKYKVDTSALDQYQLKGIVNRYKAFTNPRTMPTFFAVSPVN